MLGGGVVAVFLGHIGEVLRRDLRAKFLGALEHRVLFSLAARAGIRYRLPTLPVVVTGKWILISTVIAIIGAILGALYPAYKAAQKDPIEALAYE